MTDTTTLAPLYGAMAKAFPEIEGAMKDKNNPAFRSKYADLASVVDAVKPALANHGLWFRQVTHPAEAGVCIETLICHESGCEISGGHLFVPVDKHNAHGYGSALTYAKRYSLQTTFGIPAEDDDGNAASGPSRGRATMIDAPAPEPSKVVNPATGRMIDPMSPNQARKDGRGEKYDKLGHEITDLTEVSECIAWANANKALIETMPKAWQDDLRAKLSEHMHGLREAAETMFRTSGENGVDGRDSDMDDEGGDYLTRQFKASIAYEAAKAVA